MSTRPEVCGLSPGRFAAVVLILVLVAAAGMWRLLHTMEREPIARPTDPLPQPVAVNHFTQTQPRRLTAAPQNAVPVLAGSELVGKFPDEIEAEFCEAGGKWKFLKGSGSTRVGPSIQQHDLTAGWILRAVDDANDVK